MKNHQVRRTGRNRPRPKLALSAAGTAMALPGPRLHTRAGRSSVKLSQTRRSLVSNSPPETRPRRRGRRSSTSAVPGVSERGIRGRPRERAAFGSVLRGDGDKGRDAKGKTREGNRPIYQTSKYTFAETSTYARPLQHHQKQQRALARCAVLLPPQKFCSRVRIEASPWSASRSPSFPD